MATYGWRYVGDLIAVRFRLHHKRRHREWIAGSWLLFFRIFTHFTFSIWSPFGGTCGRSIRPTIIHPFENSVGNRLFASKSILIFGLNLSGRFSKASSKQMDFTSSNNNSPAISAKPIEYCLVDERQLKFNAALLISCSSVDSVAGSINWPTDNRLREHTMKSVSVGKKQKNDRWSKHS